MPLRRFAVLLSALAVVGALAAVAAARPASAAAARYPIGNALDGYVAGLTDPGSSPPGVNLWDCRPSAAHPDPVILVPGTLYTVAESWQALGPMLADAGYCVFALNYGADAETTLTGGRVSSIGPITASAAQLGTFVTKVRAATGAAKVDIVGWSQGGMMPRWYLDKDGGARYVEDLVGLAPSNYGTTLDGLFALIDADTSIGLPAPLTLADCPACTEQQQGSAFLRQLNAGGGLASGVHYTDIETDHDEVVTPYTNAFLSGPDVRNITLQDQCPGDLTDHLGIPYDAVALQDVVNALGADSTSFRPSCDVVLPVVGTP